MKRLWTVTRREVNSFFDHPTAYILVVAFLTLGLFLTFRTIYAAGIATLRPFFDILPWLFAIFIPAMTMRSLAEERRAGTLEWLMAQPLGETEVVVGKFVGNWLFATIALLGVLPTGIGLLLVSDADAGIMVAQFVGGMLLAAQGVAVGLWASSMTRNQITSFILAAAVGFTLILIGTPIVGIGLPPSLSSAVTQLSVVGHFENIARGVIDLRDVIYFLSTAGLFLALAVAMVSRDRLSSRRSAYRRLRMGMAALAGAVVVLNLLGEQIRGRLDLTRGGLYTLSDGSRQILSGLDDLVTLKLVVSDNLPAELQPTLRDVRDLVADLRGAGRGRLVVEEVDPDDGEEEQAEARNLGIQPTEFNVLRDDEFEVRRGWFGLALVYADETESFPYIGRTDDLEFRLISSIAAMTMEDRPSVAFLTGFGAKAAGSFPMLQQQLVERFDIKTVSLQQDTVPELGPDTIDVIVVAAPTQAMSDEAQSRVRSFVEAGGPALVLLDNNQINPQSPVTMSIQSGLEGFLAEQGVDVVPGLVMDWGSNSNISMGRQGIFNIVRPYPLWPIAFRGSDHAITRDLSNMSFGWVSAFNLTDSTRTTPLWITSAAGQIQQSGGLLLPEALGEPDEASLGTLTLAAAIDPGEDASGGRMVVVGDANFLEDQFVGASPANLIFAANAIDWLAQDEALIGIRSKTRTPPAMSFSSDFQRSLLKWGNLAGVPLLFVLTGVARVTGRRSRAERRWKEFAS